MKLIRAQEMTTIGWTGGTTTELFIHPLDGDYGKRNFNFRVSTATVETEESNFTPLLGVDRTLMVLEGEIELIHENEHSARLRKFDTDDFKGGWNTRSRGKCKDLNLMCQKGWKGSIKSYILVDSKISIDKYEGHRLLFCLKGELEINVDGKKALLGKGDILAIENDSLVEVFSKTFSELILIKTKKV